MELVKKWLRVHLRPFGRSLALTITACTAIAWSAPAFAQAITEFPVPTAQSGLEAITPPPQNDTGMWFTGSFAGKIGRISLTQAITPGPIGEFVVPGNPSAGLSSSPQFIVTGPDGALWFPDAGTNTIGRITVGGTVTNQFPIPTPFSAARGIAVGPDGALWFSPSLLISGESPLAVRVSNPHQQRRRRPHHVGAGWAVVYRTFDQQNRADCNQWCNYRVSHSDRQP
jgi:streptogramin lyase